MNKTWLTDLVGWATQEMIMYGYVMLSIVKLCSYIFYIEPKINPTT